jgi:hypothetical protein
MHHQHRYVSVAFRYAFRPRVFRGYFQHDVFTPLGGNLTRFVSVDSRYFREGSAEDIQLPQPVQLAGRKYLPGSFLAGFPKQLSSPREGFPLVLNARTDAHNCGSKSIEFWSECFKEQISELYKDFQNGDSEPVAVLLRGLPIKTTKDFSRFVQGLNFEFFLYQGGGVFAIKSTTLSLPELVSLKSTRSSCTMICRTA